MEVVHLPRAALDVARWDATIAQAGCALPYAYSWYLDVVTQGKWTALLSSDYRFVMPLPGKFWIHRPPFCQQLGIFGAELSPKILQSFLQALPRKLLAIYLPFNAPNQKHLTGLPGFIPAPNYILSLQSDYPAIRQHYHPSLRRQLDKNSPLLNLEWNVAVAPFLEFYLRHNRKKFRLSRYHQQVLCRLCHTLLERQSGSILVVRNAKGEVCAMDLIANSPGRLIHLFPASSPEGRQQAAMHFLIDRLIRQYAGQAVVLDFEGSHISGIARFYKNFGATLEPYSLYRKDPWRIGRPLGYLSRILPC
ncbi:MAG: GNAT family N-acetyltransferase [Saprospiraceae bacterium]|nr:GNAT family N-acetyltransferase [Saprospiraceae bacterium]MDP4819832.1 GNAT family N-acetyltransferase [Saprospiraceae bacterium]MDP4997512.1 GNAT family N-acetyltransferase [Saprospiraceae bacterium]